MYAQPVLGGQLQTYPRPCELGNGTVTLMSKRTAYLAAHAVRSSPDARDRLAVQPAQMHTARALRASKHGEAGCLCYAAVWQERDGPVYAGLIEVGQQSLRLAGISPDGGVLAREFGYGELIGVRVGRAPEERLRGLPVLVLELGAQAAVEVGTLNGLGTLTELADLVAELRGNASRRGWGSRRVGAPDTRILTHMKP